MDIVALNVDYFRTGERQCMHGKNHIHGPEHTHPNILNMQFYVSAKLC